jgi:hypothetical protein
VKPEQGGGVTEYGGAGWVWPNVKASSTAGGYEPDGNRITLIEDAQTGKLYRIGIAELWLDREENGNGIEIPTRAALPVIADGFKYQKHLETHIAMRCWKSEYRGADGFTYDGFKPNHRIDLKIFEDGEQIDCASALLDIGRNGDYAYVKKVEARRIQEVIETTTAAFRISQIITKVQTSDREALPADNLPTEAKHQAEWREPSIHLSRNLPYPIYDRSDGSDMIVMRPASPVPIEGRVVEADAPTGRPGEAFWLSTYLVKLIDETIRDFTVSFWVRCVRSGNLFEFNGNGHNIILAYSLESGTIQCFDGGVVVIETPILPQEWVHVVLRRSVTNTTEELALFLNAVKTVSIRIDRCVQGALDIESPAVQGTFDSGLSYQNTMGDVYQPERIGNRIMIGQGYAFGAVYYDLRLILSAVSDESILTYYNGVKRGGEGWLP